MNLYEIEESLRLLIEARDEVPAGQLAELEADTTRMLKISREKRDSFGRYIRHLESQLELIWSEQDRLKAREKKFQGDLDRLKAYLLSVMDAFEVKKLEGNTLTLKSCKNADKVEILDGTVLPARLQRVTLQMSLETYETIENALSPVDADILITETWQFERTPVLPEIAQALKTGPVPGAKMSPNGSHLEVK